MSDDKKTAAQVAMEKDCIILVAARLIALAVLTRDEISVKCLGPKCAQYGIVFGIHRCGLIK